MVHERLGCGSSFAWKLEFIEPGSKLPGGLMALYDVRGRKETPLWLPEQRTIVFCGRANGSWR